MILLPKLITESIQNLKELYKKKSLFGLEINCINLKTFHYINYDETCHLKKW